MVGVPWDTCSHYTRSVPHSLFGEEPFPHSHSATCPCRCLATHSALRHILTPSSPAGHTLPRPTFRPNRRNTALSSSSISLLKASSAAKSASGRVDTSGMIALMTSSKVLLNAWVLIAVSVAFRSLDWKIVMRGVGLDKAAMIS